jgi:hypothetical protein
VHINNIFPCCFSCKKHHSRKERMPHNKNRKNMCKGCT